MTRPMLLADFMALPRPLRADAMAGLSAAIDRVAEAGPESRRFLRYQWFAAAIEAYGGHPRSIVIEHDATALIALPTVRIGPRWLGLRQVPGCYWPFRSFPARADAGADAFAALLGMVAQEASGLRIGPIYDDDSSLAGLLQAARAAGWATLDRRVATAMRLDLAALAGSGVWPRGSTLRKNRFHEKHLAAHGKLNWRMLDGGDFPAAFDALAAVEAKSWITKRTDGRDAKFTQAGHGRFWRAAVRDPALAAMCHAALLTIDGEPAAFSFDLDTGRLRYAIANSYDPVFGKHSPGKLLHYRDLGDALGRDVATVDWGAGDGGYKATLGAEEGPAIRDWLLLRPGLSAAIGRTLAGWWRRSGQPSGEIAGDPSDGR